MSTVAGCVAYLNVHSNGDFVGQVFDQIHVRAEESLFHEGIQPLVDVDVAIVVVDRRGQFVSKRIDEIDDDEELIVARRSALMERVERLQIHGINLMAVDERAVGHRRVIVRCEHQCVAGGGSCRVDTIGDGIAGWCG